jgi:polar amino acid transport system substrate-binding protein
MRVRAGLASLALTAAIAGCGSSSPPPQSVSVAPVAVSPSGAQEITAAPTVSNLSCEDREASLRPAGRPAPAAMPTGSTMAAITERGRLVVGVDQNTYLFGYRDPASGQLEGFDVDIAREIARSIFGDPNRIDLRVVDASQRESALTSGLVDLVVRTYSITCERKQKVAFSTVYYYANQKILSPKGSGIDSAAALAGKRVCAVSGTTSLSAMTALSPKPAVFGATTWTDCLLMLQQGQVDAISTDDTVLAGLARQDPNVEVVGGSLGVEPYGIGVKKENEDLVRFVNGALERIRTDGTWERLYERSLRDLGPSPGPPPPRYQD